MFHSDPKTRALESLIERQNKTIAQLQAANGRLEAENERLRPAGQFYLAMQQTILDNPATLLDAWEEFCALLMLHSSAAEIARYAAIKRERDYSLYTFDIN